MKKVIPLFFLFIVTLHSSILNLEKTNFPSIEESISYFEDINGTLEYQHVLNKPFTQYPLKRTINFGFTESVFWFKINLHNPEPKDEEVSWWMKIDYPLLDTIDMYLLTSDGKVIKHETMGKSVPYNSRKIYSHDFISKLPIENNTDLILLIRVKTDSAMQLPLSITSSENLIEEIEQNNFFVGIYYGIFFIVLLYNAVLFIYTMDRNYLRYTLFIISFILWQLSFDGFGAKYIWGDAQWVIEHGSSTFITFASFYALYFSRHFLNTPVYAPKMDKIIVVMMVLSLAMLVASTILPYRDVIGINASLASMIPLILLISGLVVMRHEYQAARFYVAGWSSFLIGTIIFAFNKFNLLPSFYGINHTQQIGSAIEMIFLSLALADRIYLLQREYVGKLNRLNDTLNNKVNIALHEARLKDRIFVQQSRLAAMGEMIEQIAHQWRQPLHTLALINQDLYIKHKLGKCDGTCFEESHQSIDEHLQYLSKTIDDFRNFYKNDKTKSFEEMEQLTLEALKLSDVFLKYAKIKTKLEVLTMRKAYIVKNEMIQVLMNLLKNSHDAIVEHNITEGMIIITIEDFDNGIQISVEDNAGGIASENISKIFDIYFTTKGEEKGTGLGLHMCRYIIEDGFGGSIRVENSSIGARFIIRLPLNNITKKDQ